MASNSPNCPACGYPSDSVVARVKRYDLVACTACGLRFVPSSQLAKTDYDEHYRTEGIYQSHIDSVAAMSGGGLPSPVKARRRALKSIRAIGPTSLLEVGCGVGNFLRWIEDLGIDCAGIDPSGNATKLARQYLKCPIETGYLSPDVFPGRTFDVVCSWEVLEHVLDLRSFLGELTARLNRDGHLFLSTPNYGSRYMWKDVPNDPRAAPPVHVTFWNRRSLERFLEGRFEHVKVAEISVPASAAARSAGKFARRLVYADALLRPSQRRTLYAHAQRPRSD